MTKRYSDRERERVKLAWVSGQYGSIGGLSTAFSIRREVIYTWRREERWDDEKARINSESTKIATAGLVAEIAAARDAHFKTWTLFDDEIQRRFSRYKDLEQEVPLDELSVMSKIQETAQKGQYSALGDAAMLTEEREVRTEIIYPGLEASIAAAREAGDGELPAPVPPGNATGRDEIPDDRIPMIAAPEPAADRPRAEKKNRGPRKDSGPQEDSG